MTSRSDTTRVAVIMAGGSGERFWPVSRRLRPKQLLRLTDPATTMLHEAVERIRPVVPPERVFVATGEHLVAPIRATGVGVPDANVIAEPCKRNTSGCLAYAAAHVLATVEADPAKVSMAVTTADHIIGDPPAFQRAVEAALTAAEEQGALATLGVVPTRPETGYGYIEVEADIRTATDAQTVPVYRVAAFREKPHPDLAEEFVGSGHYFWNSGMFFWRLDTFLDELSHATPGLAEATQAMAEAMRAGDTGRVGEIFEALENVSIDYCLMEKARHVVVARADFPWDDAGAWPVLDRTHPQDDQGNVAAGAPILVDCEDCIVYNDAGAERMAVGVVGARDLAVVVTEDAVLVIPKDRAQDVRRVVSALKERNAKQL